MTKLSIVIPCFNEEKTLEKCVEKVIEISDDNLSLEIIIVDDASTDKSIQIAKQLETKYSEIVVIQHNKNQGKGAALRSGFKQAAGDFVAVQDADLEYNPIELKKLLGPLIDGDADVVLGSRFLSSGAHRVLYFWHFVGNRILTFLSNMFTDLNLTDMEACYKVFRRDVIQNIDIKENRFGVEPEIIAKIAQMRLRIYEMGISYRGRTYEEGKKIGVKDGLRALYCIFHYNAHKAPVPMQLLIYFFIGTVAALVNFFLFWALYSIGVSVTISVMSAFFIAAFINYLLCLSLLFKHKARWNSTKEVVMYLLVVGMVSLIDLGVTKSLLFMNYSPQFSKLMATVFGFIFNFLGRRLLVFPESTSGQWKPQINIESE